jgi:hypothetical protein
MYLTSAKLGVGTVEFLPSLVQHVMEAYGEEANGVPVPNADCQGMKSNFKGRKIENPYCVKL